MNGVRHPGWSRKFDAAAHEEIRKRAEYMTRKAIREGERLRILRSRHYYAGQFLLLIGGGHNCLARANSIAELMDFVRRASLS